MEFTNILFILITLIASAIIVLPIIQGRSQKHQRAAGSTKTLANDLEDQKHTLYTSIKEIEFDFKMGKLSEEDFEELRTTYKNDAVAVLKRIDQIKKTTTNHLASGKTQKAVGKGKKAKFCWQCGSAVTETDKFCEDCGKALSEG